MRLTGPNPYHPQTDEHYMWRCLQLALGGLGWASPNPLVGCVLVKDGQPIAEGFHRADGGLHAEMEALSTAGEAAQCATAYVGLEPCSHIGRQPSCCAGLVAAGVSRVVYGSEDTNPRTAHAARQVLRQHGIEVRAGVLRAQCDRLLDYYLHSHKSSCAWLHIKLAASLDGKIACATGHSHWLSGPESLGLAHFLRYKYDAVLVSYRTLLADDSRLSVRMEQLLPYLPQAAGMKLRQPVRTILDPRFETLGKLAGLRISDPVGQWREHLPQLVIAGRKTHMPASVPELTLRTALVGLDGGADGPLSFSELAHELRKLGIGSVLVEGGGALAGELLAQRAADKLSVAITPRLLGADAIGFTPNWGTGTIDAACRLDDAQFDVLGNDCVCSGYPVW